MWNLSKTILRSACGTCAKVDSKKAGHMSIAMPSIPERSSNERVLQKRSSVSRLRPRPTQITVDVSRSDIIVKVLVALLDRLLVDTDVAQLTIGAALQSTPHRTAHDTVNLVPTQAQLTRHCGDRHLVQ